MSSWSVLPNVQQAGGIAGVSGQLVLRDALGNAVHGWPLYLSNTGGSRLADSLQRTSGWSDNLGEFNCAYTNSLAPPEGEIEEFRAHCSVFTTDPAEVLWFWP